MNEKWFKETLEEYSRMVHRIEELQRRGVHIEKTNHWVNERKLD